jgi:hypothetical protein
VGTADTYIVTGLGEGTRYYFEVVAWNGSTEGVPSNVVSTTTLFGVTDLEETGSTGANVSLAWANPPTGAFTNLTVDYGTSAGVLSTRLPVGKVAVDTVTGLAPATTYYFEVVAWNGTTEGVPSNVVVGATLAGATRLTVTGVSAVNVSIAWTNPPIGRFTNITIEYGLAPTAMTTHLSVGEDTSYTVVGLQPSTMYYFEVVAWNGTTEGSPSNVAVGVTAPGTNGGGGSSGSGGSLGSGDYLWIAVILVVAAVAVATVVVLRRSRSKALPPAPPVPPTS